VLANLGCVLIVLYAGQSTYIIKGVPERSGACSDLAVDALRICYTF